MGKRKAFFSIYILIATIFGGVLHGPFMAYASHIDVMEKSSIAGMTDQGMHHEKFETVPEQKIEVSGDMGNSLMPCCVEDVVYSEKEGIFQARESEVLNLDVAVLEKDTLFLSLQNLTDPVLEYEYFSPPEETILASVIRIE